MNKIIFFTVLILISVISNGFGQKQTEFEQSHHKLTTSNGLIVSVYNEKAGHIDYVYPHIFANYDSALYVHPFVGNITLQTNEKPVKVEYENNSHVIKADYKHFTVRYFASFTRHDKVFYIVIRGEKSQIENLEAIAETSKNQFVSGITQLENPLEDLPVRITGTALSGSILKPYSGTIYEKYILFSFTDSLHTDSRIIDKTLTWLQNQSTSLSDAELKFMEDVFSKCHLPQKLTQSEKSVARQSIAFLKMSQVSDYEVYSNSHGQVLASLRPGLWHICWVRDGSYAIQAMTKTGMYEEARKALEFMLKAPSGYFKNYKHSDGKVYGPGVDYQISLTRYFGNGREECDYNEDGPNIEFDDFGLFMIAFCDYVEQSRDKAFLEKWSPIVSSHVADAIIACMDTNQLIKADSGPWEHHLGLTKQYAFTSGVCTRGLEKFATLQKFYGLPWQKYAEAATSIKKSIYRNMLCDNSYFKGNSNDTEKTAHEYYDAGTFELFANGLITDATIFQSHMKEYDKILRIKGERPGYIRLSSSDPYENQEWVFIDLRIAFAHLLFGNRETASQILDYLTNIAASNNNHIPEMVSNKLQMDKVTPNFMDSNIWCNCVRNTDNQLIGMIPMIGYGSGAYLITLLSYYGE
jgi:GH15 family glucan-1,4-alpha-glucosidase